MMVWVLKGIASLPLGCLYVFSDLIYVIIYYLVGYRRKVVRQNLAEAFPKKSSKERLDIEKEYYRHMCDIIVETVKLLNIPEDEMSRRIEIRGADQIRETIDKGKSAALYLGHYGNWEWAQQISIEFPENIFKASIYRPLNSNLWNDIYREIRSRWNVHIIPRKQAAKALLTKGNQPWICGFIADHRPVGGHNDNHILFLHHDTKFIYGPEKIGDRVGANFFFLEMEKVRRGYYRITFHPLQPVGNEPHPVTRAFWHRFEQIIRDHPAYWLWSHRRWKFDPVVPEL